MTYLFFLAIMAARETDWANEMIAIIGISAIYLSTPSNDGKAGSGSLKVKMKYRKETFLNKQGAVSHRIELSSNIVPGIAL